MDIQDNAPRMMTIREVAATGLLSEYTLRMMCKRGELPCIKVGNRVLINFEKLVEKLNSL